MTQKGKISFTTTYSKKDFNLAVGHLLRVLPPADVKNMILQRFQPMGITF